MADYIVETEHTESISQENKDSQKKWNYKIKITEKGSVPNHRRLENLAS